MGLREEALAAAAAAAGARVASARAVLAATLSPTDVSGFGADSSRAGLVVFTAEDVCLAVRDEGVPGVRVSLVRADAGWTYVAEVTSLACLGLLLAAQGED